VAPIDEGTLARMRSPEPSTLGVDTPIASESHGTPAAADATDTDPAIEALNLRGAARKGAYAVKKAHPTVTFTSGRRNRVDQARAMASNVVLNRKWIEETYSASKISRACQKWVDDNQDAQTVEDIAEGLLGVLDGATDAEVGRLSKHLSGDAFDVQPVEADAEAIKRTIRSLPGLDKFLEKEGGLVRWHAQF
jgi:hypothetical protein